jgi:hypothetical protein
MICTWRDCGVWQAQNHPGFTFLQGWNLPLTWLVDECAHGISPHAYVFKHGIHYLFVNRKRNAPVFRNGSNAPGKKTPAHYDKRYYTNKDKRESQKQRKRKTTGKETLHLQTSMAENTLYFNSYYSFIVPRVSKLSS